MRYSRGYLVTGNYVVGGVDLAPASGGNGFVTGTIHMGNDPDPAKNVPANADILAAFLYWETISTDISQTNGAQFRGSPLTVVKTASKPLDPTTAPCWSSGGGSGAVYTMTMFSADVLHLLPTQLDVNGNPGGRRLVNDTDLTKYGFPLHTVTLPEAGTGNQVPQSAGASLFVIYRDPTKPLTNIAVYEGIYIQAPGATMSQTIRGFLKSSTSQNALMTQIVGSGAKNPDERLLFDNGRTTTPTLLATDPFVGTPNANSDRAWSNPTFVVTSNSTPTSLMPGKDFNNGYGETVTTTVDHAKTNPYDCLSWAAIIFSTAVPDQDLDGNPDILEDNSTDVGGNPWKDPLGQFSPDIHAMGASSNHKDLFAEIGYMTTGGYTGGQGIVPAHSHRPTPAALKMVGDAFWNAPVMNLDGTPGIRVHFDVGNGFPTYSGVDDAYAERYIVRDITPGLARGGESITETACVADTQSPPRWVCQFPDYPGTVTWKRGFLAYRDAWVGDHGQQLDAAAEAACTVAGNCRKRFDRARNNIFHYVLFAHSRGIPKSPFPCLDSIGKPTGPAGNGSCTTAVNPDFSVPSSSGGRADLPAGGDALVTLGGWDNFVGTDLNQASTLMHELGHTLGLWHGGPPVQITDAVGTSPTRVNLYVEPNCKPNYLSMMSYLFGYTGLLDDDGIPHVDYSRGVIQDIDESFLSDGSLGTTPPSTPQYRTAWFLPYVAGSTPSKAKKFCNGTRFPDPLPTPWTDMARVDATTATESIDWNRNGFDSGFSQDINFSGDLSGAFAAPSSTPALHGFNDWDHVLLNQVGSRANVAGLSSEGGALDAFGGALDPFGGALDPFGGALDPFGGALDAFGGALDPFGGGTEPTYADAAAAGYASPNTFTACVLGVDCLTAPPPLHRTRLAWKAPTVGSDKVSFYSAYRVAGDTFTPASAVPVGTTSTTSLVDNEELPNGAKFTYSATATFNDGTVSGYSSSRSATITAVNDPPVANPAPNIDSYSTNQNTPLDTAALSLPGVLSNDTDDDSPAASLRAALVTPPATHGPFHGTVILNANGSFTYTPDAGFAGTDTFTYKAYDTCTLAPQCSGYSNEATVTITVKDITPPVVTLSLPAPNGLAGYFVTSPVTVGVSATDASNVSSFSCTDNGSTIAVVSLSGIGTPMANGSLSVSGEGTHSLICTARDGAVPANSGAAPGSLNTGILKIDTVPPTVTIAMPLNNATYLLNQSVASSYACSDPAPGSGVATCAGPVSSGSNFTTSTVGLNTFTVTGTDIAGNVAIKAHTYYVVFTFVLAQYKTPANGGSSVPLTWQLKDANGGLIVDLSTLIRLKSYYRPKPASGVCAIDTTGASVQLYSPATGAAGGSDFRLIQSTSSFRFNWASPSVAGCYTIEWQLKDNSGPGPAYVVLNQALLKKALVELK